MLKRSSGLFVYQVKVLLHLSWRLVFWLKRKDNMEFISGISKKEYASIKELAQGSCDGKTVLMEGMVHAVRDMGDGRL